MIALLFLSVLISFLFLYFLIEALLHPKVGFKDKPTAFKITYTMLAIIMITAQSYAVYSLVVEFNQVLKL